VLVCELATAELWDGPSSAAVAAYEFAKARSTGTEPNLGDAHHGMAEMRRTNLPAVVAITVLLALLAMASTFMVSAWQRTDAQMSIHGWIALGLGVFFSIVIGCGLMALMFYSSRRGYDEATKQIGHDKSRPGRD
jgi:hypothetical protein